MNVALTLIGLGELAFAFAKPCVMSSRLYSEECGSSLLILMSGVWPVKAALMLVGIGNPYMSLNKNMAYGMASQLGMHSRAVGLLGAGRESTWAAASSEDVFEGIIQVSAVPASVLPCIPHFCAPTTHSIHSNTYPILIIVKNHININHCFFL
jgi:hypothetical protein